jgi:hypothetical protein
MTGLALAATLLLPSCVPPPTRDYDEDEGYERYEEHLDYDEETSVERWRRENRPWGNPHYQILIGATLPDEDEIVYQDIGDDPFATVTTDLSAAPIIGFAAQLAFLDRQFDLGLEGGLTIAWWADSGSFRSSNGVTVITIDNWLILSDLFLGPYASLELFNALRVYAGAGPLLMMGFLDTDQEEEVNGSRTTVNDFDFSADLGFYGRAGLEFQLNRQSFMGLGVRRVFADLDFGGRVGEVEADAMQVMLTYTVRY